MSFFFFLFAIYYSPVSSAKHLIYQHNIFIFWPRCSGCVWSPLLESLPKTGFCSKSSVWWDWLHLGVRALWLASASPPDSFFPSPTPLQIYLSYSKLDRPLPQCWEAVALLMPEFHAYSIKITHGSKNVWALLNS